MYHELKIWPAFFDSVANGTKKFELREDDRDFAVGDTLHLREWDPDMAYDDPDMKYTGREIDARVTYILDQTAFGLKDGFVVMSIELLQ